MIPAHELRIGNYVIGAVQYHTWKLTISMIMSIATGEAEVNPIPLRPSTAFSLGLKMDENEMWASIDLPNSSNILSVNVGSGPGRGIVWLKNNVGCVHLPHCLSVHQFQNLFYALSGHELTMLGND